MRKNKSALLAVSMMAALSLGVGAAPDLGVYGSLPTPPEPKVITQADIDRIERARLKRERKALLKGKPLDTTPAL